MFSRLVLFMTFALVASTARAECVERLSYQYEDDGSDEAISLAEDLLYDNLDLLCPGTAYMRNCRTDIAPGVRLVKTTLSTSPLSPCGDPDDDEEDEEEEQEEEEDEQEEEQEDEDEQEEEQDQEDDEKEDEKCSSGGGAFALVTVKSCDPSKKEKLKTEQGDKRSLDQVITDALKKLMNIESEPESKQGLDAEKGKKISDSFKGKK